MSALTKFYLKALAIGVPCLVIAGLVVPALVSSGNTAFAALGFAILVLLPVIAGFLFWRSAISLDAQAIADRVRRAAEKVKNTAPAIALLLIVAPGLSGCGIYDRWSVPAGNVLVVVNKYGSDRGVDVEVRGPGRYWLTWNQEGHLFPTFVQSPKWTADTRDDSKDQGFTCSTREGLAIGADIGAQYEFVPDKIPTIFAKYRRGADELSDTVIRQLVADALITECSKVSVESAYGEGRDSLLNAVQSRVSGTLEPQGVRILSLNWLGRPRLPNEVVTSINSKITATQQAQQRVNEVQSTIADADKEREKAKGDADAALTRALAQAKANEIVAKSLTPELVKYKALEKWNGELPRVSSGVVPFIDVGKEQTSKP